MVVGGIMDNIGRITAIKIEILSWWFNMYLINSDFKEIN